MKLSFLFILIFAVTDLSGNSDIIRYLFLMKKIILTIDDVTDNTVDLFANGNHVSQIESGKYDTELLSRCERSWLNKDLFRKERARVLRYLFGNQWGDVVSYHGTSMTEENFIKMKGNVPLKNNVLFSLFNSITGLHAKQETEPVCYARSNEFQGLADMMSAALQTNWQNTFMSDLLDSVFGEYICSGAAFTRETFEEREQLLDSWTDSCNPYYMFWEAGSDPRQNDIRLIGMLHDISREELYFKFARHEYGLTVQDIDNIYNQPLLAAADKSYNDLSELNDYDNLSFYTPSNPELCRVVEVWTEQVKPRYQCRDRLADNQREAYFRIEQDDVQGLNDLLEENRRRLSMYDEAGVPEEKRVYITAELIVDKYWQCTFMAPDGRVLWQSESPYDFHSHPFTVSFFPYVNGEIHPFLAVLIDQQRYINRMVMMNDFAIGSSVKGWKFLPLSLKPEDMTVEEYKQQASDYDACIVYDDRKAARTNAKPEIITHAAMNLGTNEMLQTQLQLIHDISNVSGALQGKSPSAGTSAERYSLETQNATTALYPLIKRFGTFKERVAAKKCMLMQQYYEDGRDVTRRNDDKPTFYDAESARDVLFRISIKESASTPAYAMMVNDFLKDLFDRGAISIKQYLANSDLPFRDKLIQDIDAQQQQMNNGQIPASPVQVPGANPQQASAAASAFRNAVTPSDN